MRSHKHRPDAATFVMMSQAEGGVVIETPCISGTTYAVGASGGRTGAT